MKDHIHHGNAETRRELVLEELTNKVIGTAIEVHRELSPGLMEPAYEECLCHELRLRGNGFERQVSLPVEDKGPKLECGAAWM